MLESRHHKKRWSWGWTEAECSDVKQGGSSVRRKALISGDVAEKKGDNKVKKHSEGRENPGTSQLVAKDAAENL